uniref:39S ribosomal protein L48, mitochondrial (inferred by orthology to a human protein) n=1 Tax=Strongyloides venezuelensis TaxID=75913 RepID=A0A0K0F9U5_STRVS
MLCARSCMTKQIRSFASLRDKAIKIDPKYLRQPEIKDHRKYPEYPQISIVLQGYDYVPIELFQSFVHRISKRFKFNVVESYAVPGKQERVVLYKPNSSVVDKEYLLTLYQRIVRIDNIPSVKLQLFAQILRTHTPIGVDITIKDFTKEDDNCRYIPDLLLKEKQEELKMLDDPIIRKNLGWE